ncbi:MAG: hypothetical protein ACMUIM_04255 [bacterium]
MAHIFFERLEYRRSTQTILDLPAMMQPLYGVGTAIPVSSTPSYSPSQWGTTLPTIPGSIYDPSGWSNPISYGPSGMPFNPRTSIALTRPVSGMSQFGSDSYSMWMQTGQIGSALTFGMIPGNNVSIATVATAGTYGSLNQSGRYTQTQTGQWAGGMSGAASSYYSPGAGIGSVGNLASGGSSPVGAAYIKFPDLGR